MTTTPKTDTWSALRPLFLGFLGVAILVGGFGGWAAMAQVAGAIIAPGKIEVERNRQVVQHPNGGIVDEIPVEEGESVEAGDLLIQLDATLLRSDLAVVEGQLFELMARRGRLEAERSGTEDISFDDELLEIAEDRSGVAEQVQGQRTLFEARLDSIANQRSQLEERRDQIESQVEGIRAQQSALEEQLDLIEEELENQESLLDRGLTQTSRVLSLKRERARLAGTVGELTAQAAQSAGRITELEIQLSTLETDRREQAISQLRDLQYRELELAERRNSLKEQLSRLDIRAPVAGVVYGLTVFAPRSVIQAAEPLLYIIPQDRPLVITAQVAPIDIDSVYPGQEATLRFPAFSSRTTPELNGKVIQVSADSFTNEETGATYYRAEIALDKGEIDRLEDGQTLVPGMPVDAFIRTQDRTPLAYLVEPFTDYFSRAFRET